MQHHPEQERLKLELSRAQRTAAEQTERADKLKKQTDALDARVQEKQFRLMSNSRTHAFHPLLRS